MELPIQLDPITGDDLKDLQWETQLELIQYKKALRAALGREAALTRERDELLLKDRGESIE